MAVITTATAVLDDFTFTLGNMEGGGQAAVFMVKEKMPRCGPF